MLLAGDLLAMVELPSDTIPNPRQIYNYEVGMTCQVSFVSANPADGPYTTYNSGGVDMQVAAYKNRWVDKYIIQPQLDPAVRASFQQPGSVRVANCTFGKTITLCESYPEDKSAACQTKAAVPE